MKRSKKTFACLVILSTLTLTSCLQKTTSTRNSSSTNSNNQSNTGNTGNGGNNYDGNNPGSNTGDGNNPDQPGVPDAGQTIDYYTLTNITVKGRADQANQTTPFWSSVANFPANDRHIFSTDSRFNLRVVARPGPARFNTAVDGTTCEFHALPYEKLQLDVCVRAVNGTCNVSNTYTFQNVPVNQASNARRFSVPQATNDPLVVEVKDVQWDYNCKTYGYPTTGSGAVFCPVSPVGHRDCVRFDIQFSTDTTKDLPPPFY